MNSDNRTALEPRDVPCSEWREYRPLIDCYLSAGELDVAGEILDRIAAERRSGQVAWVRREEVDFHILEAEIEISRLDVMREGCELPEASEGDGPQDPEARTSRCDVLVDTLILLASREALSARDDARIALLEFRRDELRGRFREAFDRTPEFVERVLRAEDPVFLARVHLTAARCARSAERTNDAAALLRKALACAAGAQCERERAEALTLLGEQLADAGRLTEAAPLYAAALEISRQLGHEGWGARAHLRLARLMWQRGSLAKAHDLYERLTDPAQQGTGSGASMQAQLEHGELCVHMGRWQGARRHLLDCVRAARRQGAGGLLVQAYAMFACFGARRGSVQRAPRAIRLAERLLDRMHPPATLSATVALHIAEAHLGCGEPGEAAARATRALAHLGAHRDLSLRGAAHRVSGRVLLALGTGDEARETFAKAAEFARRAGDLYGQALSELGLAHVALESAHDDNERREANAARDRAERRLRSMGALPSWRPEGGPRRPHDPAPAARRSPAALPTERPEADVWAAHGIITQNGRLHAELLHAAQVAPSQLPVLIHGETGSGKELVARVIHRLSGRPGRLVVFNAATCRTELFEAELFGHRKGAFTGAHRDREGLIAQAADGTLFLDEIADLDPAAQAAMLRFLDTGEVRAVGSDTTRIIQPRIVAASHRVLSRLVAEGRFRQDLFFRLAGLELVLPPLRARQEDILPILRHFARARGIAAEAAEEILCGDFRERLLAHPWPGNVRQLSHWVDQLAALLSGGLPRAQVLQAMRRSLDVAMRSNGGLVRRASARHTPGREELIRLLRLHRGNISQMAQALQTYRTHVYRLLRARGIDYRRYRTHTR